MEILHVKHSFSESCLLLVLRSNNNKKKNDQFKFPHMEVSAD